MLAALILRTFQAVFSGHRDHTFSFNCVFPPNKLALFRLLMADNAIKAIRFHRLCRLEDKTC
jgi:hypothetical protein